MSLCTYAASVQPKYPRFKITNHLTFVGRLLSDTRENVNEK